MKEWIYIDEIKEFPDVTAAHCDTRDFRILLIDKPEDINPIKKSKSYPIEKYLFNRSEILGWLKSLEEGSGGKKQWRYLTFRNVDFTGWLKYIRLFKTEYKGEPCYFAYTTNGNMYIPLARTQYIQENIKLVHTELWHIGKMHSNRIKTGCVVLDTIEENELSQNLKFVAITEE